MNDARETFTYLENTLHFNNNSYLIDFYGD